MKNLNILLKQYIKENKIRIIILLASLILGLIISIFYVNSLNENIRLELTNYMNETNNMLIGNDYTISYLSIFYNVFINSLSYTLLIFVFGCSVILSNLIYIVFAYKGFIIGFCLSIPIMLLGKIKGSIYGIIALLIPNIIFILFTIMLSIVWLKFSYNILKNKNIYNIKKQIYSNTIISGVIFVSLILIQFPIEVLITGLIHEFIKIL